MTLGLALGTKERTIALPTEWAALDQGLWSDAAFCAAVMSLDIDRIKLAIIRKSVTGFYSHISPLEMDHIIQNYDLTLKSIPCEALTKPVHGYAWPCKDFEFASMREFIMLDEQLEKYLNGEPDAIYRMVAIMMRRVDISREDGRAPISIKDINHNATILSRFARAYASRRYVRRLCVTALIFVIGLKETVHKLYGSTLFSSSAAPSGQLNLGWIGIAMQVAEGRVFGNYEDVLNSQFHEVCAWLIVKKQEHERMEKLEVRN